MIDIIKQIGQLFILGFPGETPPGAFLEFIKERQIGGIILFGDNCVTHQRAKENIQMIKSQYDVTVPLIAVDQEGGRVCRLKGAPAEYRAASDYGKNNELEHFREDYTRAAVFMESLGINLNLAPVCDIWLNPKNSCLETRCFGGAVETVTPFVEQSVRISKKSGLLSCLKHFPGLGTASDDPHRQPATADYDELVWEQREKVPFLAGVQCGADMVMTTHVQVPNLDDVIVTGSHKIVTTMLRQRLSFDGLVITDDLLMSGASPLGDICERTVAAFEAGHDLLLFGQDFEEATQAYDYLLDAVQKGNISAERVQRSLGRIAGMKFKLDSPVLR
jgi:beta-N-acetylhexosaminidase